MHIAHRCVGKKKRVRESVKVSGHQRALALKRFLAPTSSHPPAFADLQRLSLAWASRLAGGLHDRGVHDMSRLASIATAFSDRGTILHTNGAGWLIEIYTSKSADDQPPTGLPAHLVKPGRNFTGGVTSFPASSMALRMSKSATMFAIASHMLASAKFCPAQILHNGDTCDVNGQVQS